MPWRGGGGRCPRETPLPALLCITLIHSDRQAMGVCTKASPSGGVFFNPTWGEQSAGLAFISFTEKAAWFQSMGTCCSENRQSWWWQRHREQPQLALQQLSLVSGSILLGQRAGQKLQNLLQKQSPLEFPMTDSFWDPDWPWPIPPNHHRGTDQKTYSSEGPEKFYLSAMPYWDKFMLILKSYFGGGAELRYWT